MIRRRRYIARQSARQKARAGARRACVAIVMRRAAGRCEADGLAGIACHGRLAPHERIQRSAWRNGDLDPGNVIALCAAHHDWSHLHIAAAEVAGLLGRSWQRPEGAA